jgi:hypothetical protein
MGYPTNTAKTKIIIHAAPMAWCIGVYDASSIAIAVSATDPATSLAGSDFRLLFDNLKSATVKLPLAGASQSSSNNIDITRSDGAITRFPKGSLIIDGQNDANELTEGASVDNATSKGEITLVTNEADMDSATWAAMIGTIKTNVKGTWLVIVPTGFTYEGRTSTQKVDGFYYMLGRLSNDIEQQLDNNPGSITLTFISVKYIPTTTLLPSSSVDTLINATFSAAIIGIKLKPKSWTVAPATPTTGASSDSRNIGLGDVVIKAAT